MSRHHTLGALLVGMAAACFDPPAAIVMFSCDPGDAPECPPGYSCKQDGCCHEDGSDFATFEGQCRLGGMTETTTVTASGSSGSSGSSESSGGSGTGDTSSGEGGSSGASSESTASSESGSTAGSTESSESTSGSDGTGSSGSTG